MPDIRDNLFGILAVRGHFVLPEQIEDALAQQRQYEQRGQPAPRLGEILVAQGYVTAEQVRAVLQDQGTQARPLFGELAVRWKLCSREELDVALAQQQQRRRQGGRPPRLGQILVSRHVTKPHQVMAVLRAQGKTVVQCPGCLARYNALNVRVGSRLACPRCQSTFVPLPHQREPHPDAAPSEEDVRADLTISMPAVQAPSPRQVSATQIGPYRLQVKLGTDHSGVLYKAFHAKTGNRVVLRLLDAQIQPGSAAYEAWVSAGQSATELDHPNLQRILSMGSDHGRAYVVLEYVEGASLRQRLRDRGRISAQEAVDILVHCAEALRYGHARALIHGDLRPSRVLIGLDGRVRISGLGTPKHFSEDLTLMAGQDGMVPLYAPPEILIDEEKADERSDIYSLAAIGYHMLTGRAPQEGSGVLQAGLRFASQDIVPPRALDPHLPPYLNRLLLKALASEPDERYPSIEALLSELRKCRAGLLIQADDVAEVAPEIRAGKDRAKPARPRAAPAAPRARRTRRPRTFKVQRTHAAGGHAPKVRPARKALRARAAGSASRIPPVPRRAAAGRPGGKRPPGAPLPGARRAGAGILANATPAPGALRASTPLPENSLEAMEARGEIEIRPMQLTPPRSAPAVPGRSRLRRRAERSEDRPEELPKAALSSAGAAALIVILLCAVAAGVLLFTSTGGQTPRGSTGQVTLIKNLENKEEPSGSAKSNPEPSPEQLRRERRIRNDYANTIEGYLQEHPGDPAGIVQRLDSFLTKYGNLTPTPESVRTARLVRRKEAERGAAKTLPELQERVRKMSEAYRFREAEVAVTRWKALWGAKAAGAKAGGVLARIQAQERTLAEELLTQAAKRRQAKDFKGARAALDKLVKHFSSPWAERARTERRKTGEAEIAAQAEARHEAERKKREQEAALRKAAAPARFEALLDGLRKPLARLDIAASEKLLQAAAKGLVGTPMGPAYQRLKADLETLKEVRQRAARAAQKGLLRNMRVPYKGGAYRIVGAGNKGPILELQGGRMEVKWTELREKELVEALSRATDHANGRELFGLGLAHLYAGRLYQAEQTLAAAGKLGASVETYLERIAARRKYLAEQQAQERPPKEKPAPKPETAPPAQDPAHALALQAIGWEVRRGIWKISAEKTLLGEATPDRALILLRRKLKAFTTLRLELRGEGDAAGFSFGKGRRFLVRPTPAWQKVTLEVHGGDQLRLLVDGEPRQSLEETGKISTEQLPDFLYLRCEGKKFEIRNFAIDGKFIGPRAASQDEPPKKPKAVQDPAAAKALQLLGWEIVRGVWVIRDEVFTGGPDGVHREVRLKRKFRTCTAITLEMRGAAKKAGISFGKGKQYLLRPSKQWQKVRLQIGAGGKLGLWVGGDAKPSLGDTSAVQGDTLGQTLYLVALEGGIEFRKFKLE